MFKVNGLDKRGMERIPLLRDGEIGFTGFFNDAGGQEHPALKNFGGGDKHVTFALGTTLGKPSWSLTGKQVDYAGVRGAEGMLISC